MKKLLGLLLVSMIAVSCSSVENATAKWKTPDAPDAGLKEGEKSSYLLNKDDQIKTPDQNALTPKKTKKTKKAKATK